ncbi:MAG TPA: type VI secretion system baseplate subunit TssE [Steroidobacteraceae bacterium]|nr:type VI secretion system baseplate subunit TssE [Steroidobacteraceae bacterium]
MADLTLNDRLQPALLDRLLDDERTVALVRVGIEPAALERLELPLESLIDILSAQGLALQTREAAGERVELRFTASRFQSGPAQLRSLVVRPPGAPQGVTLQSFAALEFAAVRNTELEPAERRMLSRQRLRECVHRDLGWLFNSMSLDAEQDLDPFPEVASSVLNYGMPSFAGRTASSIEPMEAAERLRRAIEIFEPRLRDVRVRPLQTARGEAQEPGHEGTLEFTIEAELWGQPVPQPMTLRTRIDTMSGDVSVTESRG